MTTRYTRKAMIENRSRQERPEAPVVAVSPLIRRLLVVGSVTLFLALLWYPPGSSQGVEAYFWSRVVGPCLFLLFFLWLAATFLARYESAAFRSTRRMATFLGISLAFFLVARLLPWSGAPAYLVPLAGLTLIWCLFFGHRMALELSLVHWFLLGLVYERLPERDAVLLMAAAGSAAVLIFFGPVRRYIHIVRMGFLVGLIQFAALVLSLLLHDLDHSPDPWAGGMVFLIPGLWAAGGGILTGFILAGLLPLFEAGLEQVTDITLLEFSDQNHPLLRKLVLEAPGTYHHSLVVGNLAEAATEAIGGHALWARVASYYHDVGKLHKPEYFSENERGIGSKHEKLSPTMSNLIISAHTKDGLEYCRHYRLPEVLTRVCLEHHGTSLIEYFYHQAQEECPPGEKVQEELFRYPGPKPQTRESAVVFLADSVEAASRTLVDPTPQRLRNLIHELVMKRLLDHQLDECGLCLCELEKIEESFSRLLTGIFHARISYPKVTTAEQGLKKMGLEDPHQREEG